MKQYAEQEAFKPRVPLQDPQIRNGLTAPRLKSPTELQEAQVVNWNNLQGNPSDNEELLALLENFETSLGYTPLRPSNNLSELTDIEEALENLGLGIDGSNDLWIRKTGGTMTGILVLGAQDGALVFQPNTALPTAQEGAMDFTGIHLMFVQGSQRRSIAFLSDTIITSEAVDNTTTETEIFSGSFDANTLDESSIFKALVAGRYSNADGTSTFTLRFKLEGVTILTMTSTAAAVTNAPFIAELISTVRVDGASGLFWSYLQGKINNVNKDACSTTTAAIDTASDQELTVTIQWSATDAGNTFSIDQALLNMN